MNFYYAELLVRGSLSAAEALNREEWRVPAAQGQPLDISLEFERIINEMAPDQVAAMRAEMISSAVPQPCWSPTGARPGGRHSLQAIGAAPLRLLAQSEQPLSAWVQRWLTEGVQAGLLVQAWMYFEGFDDGHEVRLGWQLPPPWTERQPGIWSRSLRAWEIRAAETRAEDFSGAPHLLTLPPQERSAHTWLRPESWHNWRAP